MNTILRRSLPSLLQGSFRRSYHCKSADFTTVNAQGSPATEQVEVWLGEPHEAYVMVPKHVGRAIEAACAPYGNSAHIAGPDTYPLIFDHKSRHFVHSKFSFIVIGSDSKFYSRFDTISTPHDSARPPSSIQRAD